MKNTAERVPETPGELLSHPQIDRIAKRDARLISRALRERVLITVGQRPNNEFWVPEPVQELSLVVVTLDSEGGVGAVTVSNFDRRVTITADTIIERLRNGRRNAYDAHTNIGREWNSQGDLTSLEVMHRYPLSNGRTGQFREAGFSYWKPDEERKPDKEQAPALELVEKKVFSPASTQTLVALNVLMSSLPERLDPGFKIKDFPEDRLPIKENWSFDVDWKLNIPEELRRLWIASGLAE